MARVAWLTDIHLNFLSPPGVEEFLQRVDQLQPDAVLLGGDIAEAPDFAGYLRRMARAWPCPIYFVLGNHDFYRGSIREVRRAAAEVETPDAQQQVGLHTPGCSSSKSDEQSEATTAALTYLTACQQPIVLTPHVGLIGHDGWSDGRAGNYAQSEVMLNDYFLIEELATARYKPRRLEVLQRLGDEAADHARRILPAALARFEEVVFLAHVPPFIEACWHEGKTSDANWSPHFTCVALGEALREVMLRHPQRRLTVLCGHTHSPGVAHILDNLTVHTGGAEYGQPVVQRVWEFG